MISDLQQDVKTIVPIAEGILQDTQKLLHQELALAKSEIRQEMAVAKEVSIAGAAGLCLGSLTLLMASFTLVYLIAWAIPSIPLFADFGLVTLGMLAPCVVLLKKAKELAEKSSFLPRKSIESLKSSAATFVGGGL